MLFLPIERTIQRIGFDSLRRGMRPLRRLSKNPWKSRRESKPSRISIDPGGAYGGDGTIFALIHPIFQSKNRFFSVFAAGNRRIQAKPEGWTWRESLLSRPPTRQKDFLTSCAERPFGLSAFRFGRPCAPVNGLLHGRWRGRGRKAGRAECPAGFRCPPSPGGAPCGFL